jgi:polyphosphate kinase
MAKPDPTELSLDLSATGERYVDRELSWLSFNERVLQEAESASVPLFERIRFLAIFSSNLDEFFRVRVASLRSLLEARRKKHKKKGLDPTGDSSRLARGGYRPGRRGNCR